MLPARIAACTRLLGILILISLIILAAPAGLVAGQDDKPFKDYLPLVRNTPLPAAPMLHAIENADQNNYYMVSWTPGANTISYVLEESSDENFSVSSILYSGGATYWNFPTGKQPDAYFYRVRGVNEYGSGPWSITQSVTIFPLYVGMTARWDGNGYIRGSDYYDIGIHWTNSILGLTDPTTVHNYSEFWYDPDPLDFGYGSYNTYHSIFTGKRLSSDVPPNPDWKWDYDWSLPYNADYTYGETVYIDSQPFTVSGPFAGITTFGKPVSYWKFVNQTTFLFYDDGGPWKQYVHPGDITLHFDAGPSKLMLLEDILRHWYYLGSLSNETVRYVSYLTAASSFSSSPAVTPAPEPSASALKNTATGKDKGSSRQSK